MFGHLFSFSISENIFKIFENFENNILMFSMFSVFMRWHFCSFSHFPFSLPCNLKRLAAQHDELAAIKYAIYSLPLSTLQRSHEDLVVGGSLKTQINKNNSGDTRWWCEDQVMGSSVIATLNRNNSGDTAWQHNLMGTMVVTRWWNEDLAMAVWGRSGMCLVDLQWFGNQEQCIQAVIEIIKARTWLLPFVWKCDNHLRLTIVGDGWSSRRNTKTWKWKQQIKHIFKIWKAENENDF